jgi:DNA-binding transcriptional ArsR family regulator
MSLGDGEVDESAAVRTQLRALAHPVRLRILSLLTGAPMTAAETARELGLGHANVSYHLRQLLAGGVIEVAGEERINGGVAKRYRYDSERDSARRAPSIAPDAKPTRDHRMVFAAMATELQRRAGHLRRRRGNHLTDAELWVDPTVLARVRELVTEASEQLHRGARPPREPGTVRVNATFALFEMEPDG